ncbi:MAG: radical SAM protein [Candidatus Bipolaricaulaceae bacterium]
MQLEGLDILLTYECTGRCAHCCYRAGPGAGSTMTVEEVAGYLAEVEDRQLEWVLLFGGEPFVCYDLLRASVGLAVQLAEVLVFTNGYWATGPDAARRLLPGLQAEGLDHILFSVDAFHQEHVPVERIAVGIQAPKELGFSRVEIDSRFLSEPGDDNPVNLRTWSSLDRLGRLCELDSVAADRGPARMVGRAADLLTPRLASRPGPWRECPLPGYLGGDLRAPTTVEIHPGGWVNLCAGLALGNARQHRLSDIVAAYDPDSHPIVSVLAREGPSGLLRLARRHGLSPAEGYADGCHLCYQARRLLRPAYPRHLAPARPYGAEHGGAVR